MSMQGRGVTLTAGEAAASTFCWGYHIVFAAFIAQRHELVLPPIMHAGVAVETMWLATNVSAFRSGMRGS
jgi:hypothetical protein